MANFLDNLYSAIGARSENQIPLRPYGPRYNPSSGKEDSSDLKSFGFFGPLSLPARDPWHVASEYSADANIGGKTVSYPTITEGLSKPQLASLLMAVALNRPPPQDVADKAYDNAVKRVSAGRSPFWDPRVDPFPSWSPNQYWPK